MTKYDKRDPFIKARYAVERTKLSGRWFVVDRFSPDGDGRPVVLRLFLTRREAREEVRALNAAHNAQRMGRTNG